MAKLRFDALRSSSCKNITCLDLWAPQAIFLGQRISWCTFFLFKIINNKSCQKHFSGKLAAQKLLKIKWLCGLVRALSVGQFL